MRLLLTACLLLTPAAFGGTTTPARSSQDPDPGGRFARLETHLTAVSGLSIYIDKGRVDQVKRGDILLIYPDSGPQLRAVIRSVSKTSARAELDFASSNAKTGDRCELLIPKARLAESEAAPPGGKLVVEPGPLPAPDNPTNEPQVELPAHPPWQGDLSGLDAEAPLLAPIQAMTPEERATKMRGRAWLDYSTTTDNQDTKTSYDTQRLGFDLVFENAFGKGGELEADTEFYSRSFSSTGLSTETDSSVRFNRLNYLIGGGRTEPTSYQFGRFLSRGMSEFGLIDGFELRHRLHGGNAIGFNLGSLPIPNASLQSGDDLGFAIFHHWVSDEDETFALDSGFQKTWHKGAADRDLFVFTANWRPADRAFIYASAWIDLYGTTDVSKSPGPELTQLIANATWRSKGGDGLGVTLSQFRIPELLRFEFDPVTAAELLKSKTTRLGLNGWKQVGDGLELRSRIDRWQDETDTGGRFEAGFSARNRLYDGGAVQLTLFQDDNKYSSGPGARLSATKQFPRGWLRLSFETAETQNTDFTGAQATLKRNVLRASWDMSLGKTWDLSLNAEQRAGDAEDALTLGFYLQKRFR